MTILLFMLGLAAADSGSPESPAAFSLYSTASVEAPSGGFRTHILSDPDGLILVQDNEAGLRTVAGFDRAGTWQLDLESGALRSIDDRWRVFLIGHDLHRLWLDPGSRWSREGGSFVDSLGRAVSMSSQDEAGRPGVMTYLDDKGNSISVILESVLGGLFRSAVFETLDGEFVYRYDRVLRIHAPLAHPEPEESPARAELLRWHRLHRLAHLAELPSLLSSAPLLELRSGKASLLEPEGLSERFHRYFEAVDFRDWHDRRAPRLRISGSGDMAWKAVEKRVILEHEGEERTTDFAWLESWELQDGAWRMTAIASTRAAE